MDYVFDMTEAVFSSFFCLSQSKTSNTRSNTPRLLGCEFVLQTFGIEEKYFVNPKGEVEGCPEVFLMSIHSFSARFVQWRSKIFRGSLTTLKNVCAERHVWTRNTLVVRDAMNQCTNCIHSDTHAQRKQKLSLILF